MPPKKAIAPWAAL
jgi:hypothetical protein